MSAKRISLLAAAIVSGVLTPTAPCWAQAYGAAHLVEHNDLRWFEPVELDLDGQMPRRDAGFFGSFDKLYWATPQPKLEIGQAGLVVDSERVFRAPTLDVALTSLEQTETFSFVDNAEEALSFGGINFAVFEENDPTIRRDDVEQRLSFNDLDFAFRLGNPTGTPLTNIAQMRIAIARIQAGFTTDPDGNPATNDGVAVPGMNVRVAGEPSPYGVRNSIRDALPDAGFAWGERIEFGYSDGEQGWMMTILDGPESVSGGVYGAGEGHIFFSQSGTDTFGADPYFLGDLEDDDGDGIGDGDGEPNTVDIWALGFGSVAVNFNLPNEDFLTGFRDYSRGDSPHTVFGPIYYVGNTGAEFTDFDVVGIDFSGGGGTVNTDAATAISAQLLADVNGGTMTPAQATNINNLIANSITALQGTVGGIGDDATAAAFANVITAIAGIQTAIDGAGTDPFSAADKTAVNNQITVLNTALAALDANIAGLNLADGGGANTDVNVTAEERLADDLNGNGGNGFRRVVSLVDGELVTIGTIIDFGDLYEFNVFFDDVTVRNNTEIDGVELMRTHQLSTAHKMQQGRWDDMRLAYGVRFLNVSDEFYFQGRGSILGRTTVSTEVENQVIAPQLGLRWIRRDGPWDFVFEGRGAVGYNVVDVDQSGIFGEELIPGALNRPSTGRTTTSQDGIRYDEFSPIGELRAQLRYRVADSITLQAGYTAKYVGNIHRGGDSTAWNAPDFGIHDHTSDIFTNGLNFGIELRH